MGSQNRFFAQMAPRSSQQTVCVTPSENTQYAITQSLTSVLLGFALALVFASMSLAQDPVKADLEAS
jgi:hypothetical protein